MVKKLQPMISFHSTELCLFESGKCKKDKKKKEVITNCSVPLWLPNMPDDITSSVLALETIVGNNSTHLFYKTAIIFIIQC